MDLSLIGLSLLAIGWIVQLVSSWKGKNEIQSWFLIVYLFGVILLVVDGYMNNLTWMALLNLVTLVAAGLVLLKLKKPVKTRKK